VPTAKVWVTAKLPLPSPIKVETLPALVLQLEDLEGPRY
jgi:hypothetical protein